MRIFQCFTFDLKNSVLFKNTMELLEEFLQKQGFTYQRILLQMEGVGKGLLRQFPELAPFYCVEEEAEEECFSNLQPDFSANRSPDRDAVQRLVKKVPRSVRPSFLVIGLDGINWFPDAKAKLYIQDAAAYAKDQKITKFPESFYSNMILFGKKNVQSHKGNYIQVKIDVTDEKTGGIRQCSDILEQLETAFGAPVKQEQVCVFEQGKEAEQLRRQREQMQDKLNVLRAALVTPMAFDKQKMKTMGKIKNYRLAPSGPRVGFGPPEKYQQYAVPLELPHILKSPLMMKPEGRLSVKMAWKSAFFGMGYQFVSGKKRLFRMKKRNENGHWFRLEFVRGFLGNAQITGAIIVEGYNFYESFRFDGCFIKNQRELHWYMENFAVIVRYVERELSEYLLHHYGKTPEWYQTNNEKYLIQGFLQWMH